MPPLPPTAKRHAAYELKRWFSSLCSVLKAVPYLLLRSYRSWVIESEYLAILIKHVITKQQLGIECSMAAQCEQIIMGC